MALIGVHFGAQVQNTLLSFGVIHGGKHNHKLVAPQPRYVVATAAGAFQRRPHGLQDLISRQMAVLVVDPFETVEVAE
jgi:hypothetical protein